MIDMDKLCKGCLLFEQVVEGLDGCPICLDNDKHYFRTPQFMRSL